MHSSQKQVVYFLTSLARRTFQVSRTFLLHYLVKSQQVTFRSTKRLPNLSALPPLLSEQHVFVGDERFHHKSLVADVVERRHGVQLGGPHQRRAEDDAQVLAGHEVLLLALGHSGWGEDGKHASALVTTTLEINPHQVTSVINLATTEGV